MKILQDIIHTLRIQILQLLHGEYSSWETVREVGFWELGTKIESAIYCLLLIDEYSLEKDEIPRRLKLCSKLLYEVRSTLEKEIKTEFVSPIEIHGFKRMIDTLIHCEELVPKKL